MYIDIARAHISEREQQRVRSERIIDIAVCIERALAVPPLADLQTIAGADDRERAGAAATAPRRPETRLEQANDATEHTRAERHADRQRNHRHEWVENRRGRVENVGHTRSVELGLIVELHIRKPPITAYANNDTSRATMYVTIASAAGQSTSDVSTIAALPTASPAAQPQQ